VALGAGDTVTCTYRNRFRRPPSGLALAKVTLGGVGTFGFSIDGQGEHVAGSATTTEPGVPTRVAPYGPIADLPAGAYRVTEDLPPDRGGTWSLERVACAPASRLSDTARITSEIVVPDGPATVCAFTNRFTPRGGSRCGRSRWAESPRRDSRSDPGCTCDVPSHLYSLSFAPNPDWTQTYSPQPEIRAYLQRLAREHDLYRSIRLGTTVTAADWDDEAGRWNLETSAGPVSARLLIAGVGTLAEPRIPDLEGLDAFEGAVFHSARWDHDHDLSGERVAAIGTGASAIQFVPAIQPEVAALHVFQRTAPWVVPHTNRRISRAERRLYRRLPALQKAVRAAIYAARELLVLGFVKHPPLMRIPERLSRRHMRE
jgi:hypothetical protein